MSCMDSKALGDFTIFGFTSNKTDLLQHRIPNRLGVEPQVINLGEAGRFFFYTSYGDLAESESAVAVKLGFARSPSTLPLSSLALLEQGVVSPDGIAADKLLGNASVVCFSKRTSRFSVYQTLLSVSQLHYTKLEGSFVFADNLRTLVRLLDDVQVNEQAVPMHFLFRLAPGNLTYFEGIRSLFPGELLCWKDGDLKISLARDLQNSREHVLLRQNDSESSMMIFDHLKRIVGGYVNGFSAEASQFATLLSGGVDSSLIQLALNERRLFQVPLKSYSYAMVTPGFDAEIAYADQARRSLLTAHEVVDVAPEAYLDLLTRTIVTVCHPSLAVETDPCILGLAEYLDERAPDVRFCFVGHGADALFGLGIARKLALLDAARKVPGSRWSLSLLSNLIQPRFPDKAHGLREVSSMLSALESPNSFGNPANRVAVYTSIEMARRCFGDTQLLQALEYRRDLAARYLPHAGVMEQAHTIDLLTWDYESAVFGYQLFLAHHKEKLYPFLDESMIRLAYTFAPAVRYIKGTEVKALLKQILVQKSLPAIAANSKRGGTFEKDLFDWMGHGVLRDRVYSIKRPGFVSSKDFQHLLEHPSSFLWLLLIFDIFQEQVIAKYADLT